MDTGGWWASRPRPPPPRPVVTAAPALGVRDLPGVPQQLVVLTPGELGSGYQGAPRPSPRPSTEHQ